MSNTIRMLTGRGDMYAQAAVARQDLESERVAVHHLRADVDSYRYRSKVHKYTYTCTYKYTYKCTAIDIILL